ncbi:MAG: AmmeMemoRadiSam system radical SAM enzyme [Oscillochloridaceae bacterium]|nr:AmmeMemoRadiSam system radical SAM enzyme [Chloroflexaceae bacterium]MDW8391612.1 AmmeMemoRadiSam system radical SAM enzyme [Oscillochloridaceae bacterium]
MPERTFLEPGVIVGEWWHRLDDGRVRCDLCPRGCALREGQRGFCFVRQARNGGIALTSYGRASGFCVDPIEKKPLYHFYPGTAVLSFGTVGCNLGCRFCQNWNISKARSPDWLSARASPGAVADAAVAAGCHSVAFTYNDPVIFAEYAIDCAEAARARGLRTVAVSAGYISPAAREAFFASMDAANIDLKAFDEDFYRKICLAHLAPVLDTLRYIRHETAVWLEVTNLLIPGYNDAPDQVARLCEWFVENLGPDVPLHFSAFHPDYRMRDVPPTPAATLIRAREQALAAGLRYVYTGNVRNPAGEATYCATCGALLIERDWYRPGRWNLDRQGRCKQCGAALPGRFEPQPGRWGRRIAPVEIHG